MFLMEFVKMLSLNNYKKKIIKSIFGICISKNTLHIRNFVLNFQAFLASE